MQNYQAAVSDISQSKEREVAGIRADLEAALAEKDARKNLRKFFEVDKEHVVAYGLSVLAKEQLIASKYAQEAIKKYQIDKDKPMPAKL